MPSRRKHAQSLNSIRQGSGTTTSHMRGRGSISNSHHQTTAAGPAANFGCTSPAPPTADSESIRLPGAGPSCRSLDSGSTIVAGVPAAQAPPDHTSGSTSNPSGASLANPCTTIDCRRRPRPALRLDQSPSRGTFLRRPRMNSNSNSYWGDDLPSESERSYSSDDYDEDGDDDDGDDDDDDGTDHIDNTGVNVDGIPTLVWYSYRARILRSRYQRVDIDNTDAFPPLTTAAPAAAAQLDRDITHPRPNSPSAIHAAVGAQALDPQLNTVSSTHTLASARTLAGEAAILLENYSQSISRQDQETCDRETIRTVLDSVHKIWERLVEADGVHGAGYSAKASGSSSRCCMWGGRAAAASESESDQDFRPYSACIVCYNAVADTVLIPCHHLVLCLVRSGPH